MMEHLVTLHHVKMWLEYRREKVPESEADLIEKCKELLQNKRKFEYKVINSDDLHYKCKKARIRFTKKAADEIYTREIFGGTLSPSDNSPGPEQKQSESGGKSAVRTKKKVLRKPKKITSCPGIEKLGNIRDVSEDTTAQPPSLPPPVVDSTEPVREPTETSSLAEKEPENVPDKSVPDPGVLILSPTRSQWRSLTNQCPILESGNVNPENPMNSIKAEIVDEIKVEELKADVRAIVPSHSENEMIDLTQKSKLSVTEYKSLQQEKEKVREAEEIVALGERKTVPTSRQSRLSETKVKKEEPPDEVSELDHRAMAASDLLPVPEENTTGVQGKDSPSDFNPEIVYKKKVKEAVNDLLLNYYDDGSDRTNKTIKISHSEEFIKLCKDFSHQIREEIKDTYISMNGSLEGIEKVNVMEFGVDNIIHKYFETLPVLNSQK